MLCGLVLACPSLIWGQSGKTRDVPPTGARENRSDDEKNRERAAPRKPTAREEQQVLAFVKEHHSELTQLLIYLKENEHRQYAAAIRELLRTQERLNGLAKRDEVRYGLELAYWKLESRSRLVAAKIMMKDRALLRAELKALLAEQLRVKQEMLELDKARFSERLERIQQQVDRLSQHSDEEIERLTRSLLKQRSEPRAGESARKEDRPNGERGRPGAGKKDKVDSPSDDTEPTNQNR